MRSKPALSLVAVTLAAPALAAPANVVKAPVLTPGDTWTYENGRLVGGARRTTHDIATLTRADSRMTIVEIHPAGATAPGREHLFGPEWSRVRSVNGVQTVVNRPLAFPLSPGKTWTLSFSENTPADRTHVRESFETTYKVEGWEDVVVPAGTFRALKITGDGTWTAYLPGNVLVTKGRAANGANLASATGQAPRVASGRTLATFWYVPEVRRWVKSDEDIFSSTGVQTQHTTSELEAYTLAAGAAADAPKAEVHKAEAPRTRPAPARPAAAPPKTPAPSLLQELRWHPARAGLDRNA